VLVTKAEVVPSWCCHTLKFRKYFSMPARAVDVMSARCRQDVLHTVSEKWWHGTLAKCKHNFMMPHWHAYRRYIHILTVDVSSLCR